MKIAITVWGKRISPVFDAAQTLLVVEIKERQVVSSQQLQLWPGRTGETVRLLSVSGIEVLICGAISQDPAEQIEASGIVLVPFIAGRADQVLEWYAKGLSITGYQMPGCNCHGNGRGRGRRCGKVQEVEADLCDDVKSEN